MAKQVKTVRNSARRGTDGKRGFTLVELVVAMALLAILTAMIVSFSVLVSGYAKDSRAVTDYTEDCATIKEAVIAYARARDVEDAFFSVAGGALVCPDGSVLTFSEGALTVSGESLASGLDSIESMTVDQSEKLIRFTLTPEDAESFSPYVFVLSFRTVGEGD